ncbi:MAG: TrkA C-terminal domain-containing protein [Rhodothermales bacterium]
MIGIAVSVAVILIAVIFIDITLGDHEGETALVGLRLSEISFPEETPVAMIRRGGDLMVPRGDTELRHGDRLTVIGQPESTKAQRLQFASGSHGLE